MTYDPFADLPDVAPEAVLAHTAEVCVSPTGITRREAEARELQRIENSILEKSLKILDGVVSFNEVAFDATEPPEEWVLEMGEQEALERFRVVKAGQMPEKAAPIGVKVAMRTALGIQALRQGAKQAPQLSVAVMMPAPQRQYELVEVNE